MTIDGKVALITGAAGNLGKAVANAFHEAGAKLALVDVEPAALAAVYPDAGERRLLVAADLLDESSIAEAAESVRRRFGHIDVLCNIAGGFAAGPPVHEMPAATWQKMFDLNATS